MIGWVYGSPAQLNDVWQAMGDHFRKGGSFVGIMIVVLVIMAMVALAYYLTMRQQRRDSPVRSADPETLFTDLLRKLELTPELQQRFTMLAGDLRLEHPTVMLLDPAILDRTLEHWREAHPRNEADDRAMSEFARQVKPLLFPAGKGVGVPPDA